MKSMKLSRETRRNWLIDAVVLFHAVLAGVSGLYLLLVPGGYQGGRNVLYGVTILFPRSVWNDLHIWGGLAMLTAVIIHLAIHWRWVKMSSLRAYKSVCVSGCRISKGAKINMAVDAAIALSFLMTAVTGVYLLFLPAAGYRGGHNLASDAAILFSRTGWVSLHSWAAGFLLVAAIIHIWIHRRWISKVTRKFFLSLVPVPAA